MSTALLAERSPCHRRQTVQKLSCRPLGCVRIVAVFWLDAVL